MTVYVRITWNDGTTEKKTGFSSIQEAALWLDCHFGQYTEASIKIEARE